MLIGFLAAGASAYAQQENDGELKPVEIEITKERQITLTQANRLFEKIPPRPAEPIKPEITYLFRSFSFSTPELNPVIRPLKLKDASTGGESYNGYMSLGYGNYASPYIEGFVTSKPNKNHLFGAHGFLNNSGKGPVDGKNSASGNTGLSVFAQTYGKELALRARASYEGRRTYFYGYPDGTDVSRDTIKQTFSLVGLDLGLTNARNSNFQYDLGGKFSYLTDNFKATESLVNLDFKSAYKLGEENSIRITGNYLLLGRKDVGIQAKPRSLFTAGASYQFKTATNLKLDVGAVIALENDTIDNKDFHFYPDVRLTYPISPSVDVVGSLTGGIDAVSLHSLVKENMWLAPSVNIAHTNRLYDLQAGVRARLGAKVLIGSGISFASLKNLYFFVNDPADQAKFVTVYDQGATKRTNFYATISFAHADYARFTLRGDMFSYSTDKLKDPYHRPGYRFTASASYNVYKKILLSADIIAQGNAKALVNNVTLETKTLAPAFDLNFKVEYLVSEKFSAFVAFNNITSNKYSVYLNYPVRGFQGLAGITWRF